MKLIGAAVRALTISFLGLVACSSNDESTGQATSGTCNPGSSCVCDGDGDCARTCSGASCQMTCNGNGGCHLSCPQGGCTVSCNGAGGCSIADCSNCTCKPGTKGGACL